MMDVVTRVQQDDFIRGRYVLTDSSLKYELMQAPLQLECPLSYMGVLWSMHAGCIPKVMFSMSVAELDTVLEYVNVALQWKAKKLHLFMGRYWTFSHTKALSAILIQRRLSNLEKLINEYNLPVSITLLKSHQN